MIRFPVPDLLLENARNFDESASGSLKDASTVVLVRDGFDGLEAYLLRRSLELKFAPGYYVFPGGKSQETDFDPIRWHGPDALYWARAFNCETSTARSLVVAAARETFEETGILLASRADGAFTAESSHRKRRALLEQGHISFAKFLAAEHLRLRADWLVPWSQWTTPKFEPRRFDTRFFLAVVPTGQSVDHVCGESDRAGWTPITQAIQAARDGVIKMLPPTLTTCTELAGKTTQELLTEGRYRRPTRWSGHLVSERNEYFIEARPDDTRRSTSGR